jgi:Adenylate and Guanylate cyclase catalytic domain
MDLEERLQGRAYVETERSRVLVTLLFTDLVGSTERLVRLGDRDWYELLALHHRTVREHLDRFAGREVDTSGDGFLATFDTASQAVSCGSGLTRSLAQLDLDARVGVHTGECDRLGTKYSGVAVHCRGSGRSASRTSRGAGHRNGQGGRRRRRTELLRAWEPRAEGVAGRLATLRGGRDRTGGSTGSREAFGAPVVPFGPHDRSSSRVRTGARQLMRRRMSPRRSARAHPLGGLG